MGARTAVRVTGTALALLLLALLPGSAGAECSRVGPADVGDSCAAAPAPDGKPAPAPADKPTADDARRAPAGFLSLINRDRAASGLGALGRNTRLEKIALEHARRMAAQGRISHNDSLFSAATLASLGNPDALGENVGRGTSTEWLHKAFMDSPRHRANILEGQYAQSGIAVVLAHDELWVVATFMSPTRPVALAGSGGRRAAFQEVADAPLLKGPRLGAWRWTRPAEKPASVALIPLAADTKVLGVSKTIRRVPKSLAVIALLIGFTVVLGAGAGREGEAEIV